jgi:AAA domain
MLNGMEDLAEALRKNRPPPPQDEEFDAPPGPPPEPPEVFDLAEWDWGDDNEPIPPRGWLLGNLLCRQFISAIFADGGVGKTALIIAMAMSLATGRALIGEKVFVRSRVLIVCFEDGAAELRRRLTAAAIHYEISKDEMRGHLFITAINRADVKLAASYGNGDVRPGKLGDALDQSIARRQIDAVFLDPFVKTHAVPENDNSAIDTVIDMLAALASKNDCAVCTPHHTNKGPAEAGNANSGRGASSMKDGGRLVQTLMPMSEAEGKLFGLDPEEIASMVRLDNGKVNLVRRSPHAKWFQLVGVPIRNGNELYPEGDDIQTVERWREPDTFADLGTVVLNQILDEIDAGLPATANCPDGNRYSNANAAKSRAAWKVVHKHATSKNETQCRYIINTWVKNGVLILEEFQDTNAREPAKGLRLVPSKRPG